MSYCTNCGNIIEGKIKFCPNCGVSIIYPLAESISNKPPEIQIEKPQIKEARLRDIREFFSEGKNVYFGNNIPWKIFKEFLRNFNGYQIGNLEYLVYCNNTGWGSGSSNGFAIAKNVDKLLLLICSYETKQVLVKVVAQNYFSFFEINSDNIFYLEDMKLNIEQINRLKNESTIFQFSIMREIGAFNELVTFTEIFNNSEFELISNGKKISSDQLSSLNSMPLIQKFIIFIIAFGFIAGLIARACN
ncbi:MAG: hypothetical protein WCP61_07985 [Chitinophagia bacterium]